MRKDKKQPMNFWEGVTSRPIQDEEERRKLEASSRENSEANEETRRMQARADRERGPSIMANMPQSVQDEINTRMKAEMSRVKDLKRLKTGPMFGHGKK